MTRFYFPTSANLLLKMFRYKTRSNYEVAGKEAVINERDIFSPIFCTIHIPLAIYYPRESVALGHDIDFINHKSRRFGEEIMLFNFLQTLILCRRGT